MRTAAPVIGGAIIFGLNAKLDSPGSVSLHTYVVIIGIMGAGPFISLLISNPDQVQRRDGVKIYLRKQGWSQTIRQFFKVLSSQNVRSFCISSNKHSAQVSATDSPSLPFVLHIMVLQFLHRYASSPAPLIGIN